MSTKNLDGLWISSNSNPQGIWKVNIYPRILFFNTLKNEVYEGNFFNNSNVKHTYSAIDNFIEISNNSSFEILNINSEKLILRYGKQTLSYNKIKSSTNDYNQNEIENKLMDKYFDLENMKIFFSTEPISFLGKENKVSNQNNLSYQLSVDDFVSNRKLFGHYTIDYFDNDKVIMFMLIDSEYYVRKYQIIKIDTLGIHLLDLDKNIEFIMKN